MGEFSFGVILAILSLLIMAVNIFVVVVLVQLIWKSRCLGLCFILNLAVADSLVGFTVTGLVTEELSSPEHQTPQNYCVLRMACVTFPSAASIITVILVSFDRYLTIKHPFQYFKIMCGPVVGVCIGGLWLLACLVGFLPMIVHSFQQKNYQGLCTFFKVFQPTYVLAIFCVGFFPGFFIFIYFHCHLLKIASLHAQQIQGLEPIGFTATCPGPKCSTATKALRTVAILVGCFAVLWSPFFIGSIVQIACQQCLLDHLLERYLWVLGVCNSLVNPLIYAYRQKEVRLQICQMFLCMKIKVFPLFHVNSQSRAPDRTGPSVHTISLAHLEE
ncbi:glucose-dependent insulinotropic receptor [Sceloporus undulatus]|uniref:glucose-dependent insulinotropic receptor n=1 Tax=Sceloporus undulatus TaxID=8520 RepID=UPI001C4BF54F|nr:glucose-dependent insulinotropic receptor [Sceloporus undulatus]